MNMKAAGGILILAGTSIGAGMLALPVILGPTGLYFSTLLLLAGFAYMCYTVYLLLEVNLTLKDNANFISMIGRHLGPFSQGVAWLSTLLLLYAVSAAYMSGGGSLFFEASMYLGFPFPSKTVAVLAFSGFFGVVAVIKTSLVDLFNRFLMISLIIAFFAMVFGAMFKAPTFEFPTGDPTYLMAAMPVVFLSFTCHPVFPSISAYFDYDLKTLKWVIALGCLIPFVFYSIWDVVIMGLLPQTGADGLIALNHAEDPVTAMSSALSHRLSLTWLSRAVAAFSFFAMTTSFIAVILSLSDFIRDGLNLNDSVNGRIFTAISVLLPPLFFALLYPSGFILALGYAGVFVAILYGIFPALMVWQSRYVTHESVEYQAPGGKTALVFTVLISLLVIAFQIGSTVGLLPTV